MTIEKSPTGNHMVTDRDEKINPDEYGVCSKCGEQAHVENLVTVKDKDACRWCWVKEEHTYRCNKCHEEFGATGIPTECPICGSWYIEHELARICVWISDEQTRRTQEERSLPKIINIAS